MKKGQLVSHETAALVWEQYAANAYTVEGLMKTHRLPRGVVNHIISVGGCLAVGHCLFHLRESQQG